MLTGPDVSRYQPTWSPAPDDDFVFIKCSEGRSVLNTYRQGQQDAARARGLIVGWYHYLWPDNAIEQAAYFVENAILEDGDLLVCDWEKNRSGTVPSEADKDAFMAETQRLLPEHRVGLYVNASMWNASTKQAGDFLWIAHYGVQKPNIVEPWTFWQWTDTPIDQNFCRFTTPESLRSWATALIPEAPVNMTVEEYEKLVDDVAAEVATRIPTAAEIAAAVVAQLGPVLDDLPEAIWDSPEVDMLRTGTDVIRPKTALERLLKRAG